MPGKLTLGGQVEQAPPPDSVLVSSFIEQLDGNISFCSSSLDHDITSEKIIVQIGHRPSKTHSSPRPNHTRKTIKRDNKVLQAVSLPKISSYNMRSLWSKSSNFGTDMLDRSCSVSFLSEVWQRAENKKHQYKIEELFEIRGLKYISTPRSGNRRGGGAAIVVDTTKFSVTKLNISIPNNLEIVWALVKPNEICGKISKLITCCFYCPPKSKKKSSLIDHMTLTLQYLRSSFPTAGVLISGDRNDLSIPRLLSTDPSLRQIVQKGTRGPNILTVILTDLEAYYEEPVIVPPILVDDPSKGGVPSDHNGVIVVPRNSAIPVNKLKIAKTIRPITSSDIINIGQVLTNESWQFMQPNLSSTDLTDIFEYYSGEILNTFCPEKIVFSRPGANPFVTEEMKVIKRSIMREYEKRGKSAKYEQLKAKFEKKMRNQALKYKQKVLEDVKNGDRACAYSALRKLGTWPGDNNPGTFTLPSHLDRNLSTTQSADIIADHFAAISRDYKPIDILNFPPKMREDLQAPDLSLVPKLEEFQVYQKIRKSKKPNSAVPGDFPKKLVQEFSCEIAVPATIIYNAILQTQEYPRQWVREYQIPIPKFRPPSSEDELRNIAKTSYLSKCFESFLSDWLLPIVKPYIDPYQYGLKGASISHYLFQLLKFTHDYLDLKEPFAVVVAMVDQSKAFNRVSHQMVIEDLHDMHVPSWLLLILISYLTKRTMVLSYKGKTSSPRDLPGSSPQGAFLGIFFFIVKYNGVALRPQIPRILFNTECKFKLEKCTTEQCMKHAKDMHVIYIDDLSEAEAIDLKKQLVKDPLQRPFPLNYHERTQHVFPAQQSRLQKQLQKIENFSIQNKMKINESKSKIMLFNRSKKFDFPPEYSFSNGQNLEVIEETKLLGIVLTSDLRWASNTNYIFKRAMSKMWLLRRMKKLQLEPQLICDYYMKEIRILAEQGVALWNAGLTKGQINDLERIQKVALKIILGDNYGSYDMACKFFDLKTLSERRDILCTNFALKLFRSDKSEQFFKHRKVKTRNDDPLIEKKCNTKRCFNAPHNYLARLVNQNKHKLKNN